MRCPGPHCNLGPHCWRDPKEHKHYKLRTHHLKGLIRHVEQGGILLTHNDVPEDIRQQLYAEEQQRLERHRSRSSSSLPPINITNVLPVPSSQFSVPAASVPACDLTESSSGKHSPLTVPGARDVAVKEYSHWQQSQVDDEFLKIEYQKASGIALADGFDLEQIHENQDPKHFSDQGVKIGIARRFVSDIKRWVKQYECSSRVETLD
ncbi:hypothetical protein BS50DRAFT_505256 [Corynespora cassiicola Philippines]|uniref:Uncharacterized protein n=1 Tax=Corynespora cassiicola Philippines TaxID=1448308 RepID=A0A2T2N6M1_CORCC|nr:hypothetical protein BS50DRAFT_505256 [Corynespora cassiicola Philippines]